eukprot:GFYU01002895.1.p1 GENE.GFYU01002895.1~~GFYU01002895.1.p1  ORF type:complete len:398 (+),score=113.11 GFYU01002895.1:129-1322(+)
MDTISPGGAETSLGNIKGVMLCNRPTKTLGPPVRTMTGPQPFIAGSHRDEPLGINPTKHFAMTEGGTKKSRKEGVDYLARHKQWLQDMQSLKEEIRAELDHNSKVEDQKRKRFTERAQQLRTAIREAKDMRMDSIEGNDNGDGADGDADALVRKVGDYGTHVLSQIVQGDGVGDSVSKMKQLDSRIKQAEKKKGSRPLWAMTPDEIERRENEEEEDVLNFVSNLDFDKYMEDVEVKQALAAVKERVEALEKSHKLEDIKENREAMLEQRKAEKIEEDVAKAERLADADISAMYDEDEDRENGWDTSVRVDEDGKRIDDPLSKMVADRVLHSSDMRRVHSSQSVQKIVENMQDGVTAAELGLVPVKVKLVNESTNRAEAMRKNQNPSNLPYLYRNPAI